jgi:hypothetical protein
MNPCGSSGCVSCESSGASRAIKDVGIAWVHTGAAQIHSPFWSFWVCLGNFPTGGKQPALITLVFNILAALNPKVTRLEVAFGKCNSDSLCLFMFHGCVNAQIRQQVFTTCHSTGIIDSKSRCRWCIEPSIRRVQLGYCTGRGTETSYSNSWVHRVAKQSQSPRTHNNHRQELKHAK